MPEHASQWSAPPAMEIDAAARYEAIVQTSAGAFTIELFAGESPRAVNNFVFLARQGFFAANQFFRVVPQFVIQTGDPGNSGTGGPGYSWDDELPVPFPYGAGIVAMANAGPNTNGSQWFICTGPQSAGLNRYPNYTQFGRVTEGMDVVERIGRGKVRPNPMTGEQSQPLEPVSIQAVEIRETPAQ